MKIAQTTTTKQITPEQVIAKKFGVPVAAVKHAVGIGAVTIGKFRGKPAFLLGVKGYNLHACHLDGSELIPVGRQRPGWPIGVDGIRNGVVVVFSVKDYWAAQKFIMKEGRDFDGRVLFFTDTAQPIDDEALRRIGGRRFRFFIPGDAKLDECLKLAEQVRNYFSTVSIFDFLDLDKENGKPVKNLHDLLSLSDECRGRNDISCLVP